MALGILGNLSPRGNRARGTFNRGSGGGLGARPTMARTGGGGASAALRNRMAAIGGGGGLRPGVERDGDGPRHRVGSRAGTGGFAQMVARDFGVTPEQARHALARILAAVKNVPSDPRRLYFALTGAATTPISKLEWGDATGGLFTSTVSLQTADTGLYPHWMELQLIPEDDAVTVGCEVEFSGFTVNPIPLLISSADGKVRLPVNEVWTSAQQMKFSLDLEANNLAEVQFTIYGGPPPKDHGQGFDTLTEVLQKYAQGGDIDG